VKPDDLSLSFQDLVDQSGVTERTVRYYFQRGVLPPPPSQGRGVRYSRGYLDRLRLIRQLQEDNWSLELIQKKLNGLSDADIADLVKTQHPEKPATTKSLSGYLDAALGRPLKSAPLPDPGQEVWASRRSGTFRSRWDRITLTEDVEIMVRHPLTREKSEQLEELIRLATRILKN
jgi:DNA-binding transcriptional MerR regulator